MVDQHISITISKDSGMPRPRNIAMASKKLSATAIYHRHASFVNVRAGDAGGATYHGTVSAVDALAAAFESGPEVEVVAVLGDDRRLDGTAVVETSGDGDEVVRVDGLAS
jgi:hypothetical protein